MNTEATNINDVTGLGTKPEIERKYLVKSGSGYFIRFNNTDGTPHLSSNKILATKLTAEEGLQVLDMLKEKGYEGMLLIG